jgi:DNA-directed RNA polymerase specialized sigma24 family protein
MTYRQVGQALGLKERSVRHRMGRIRKLLGLEKKGKI